MSPGGDKFVAGVGKVDLTPPPGIPLFGYSWAGSNVGAGVRTRLYARAVYLEDSSGERIALVQCDLGAISSLLHKTVASLVTHETGISADRLLLAATHTHSGPGGYFGTGLYDNFGATRIGFDPEMLEFLSTRIARAIEDAYQRRAPAKLAIGQIAIHTLTRNRSIDAYLHDRHHAGVNAPPFDESPEYQAVNPIFTMIRVDRTGGGISQPLGAFSNFAVHGTVVSEKNDLYNADVQAAAERSLEQQLKKDFKLRDDFVVHAC